MVEKGEAPGWRTARSLFMAVWPTWITFPICPSGYQGQQQINLSNREGDFQVASFSETSLASSGEGYRTQFCSTNQIVSQASSPCSVYESQLQKTCASVCDNAVHLHHSNTPFID